MDGLSEVSVHLRDYDIIWAFSVRVECIIEDKR